MLSAIIENTVTKEDEYLYLKRDNNKLIYYGYSIQNSEVKPIDRDIVSKIYNLLRINENCVYIEDYLDYKVYLDKENNIKHYLKNDVENFEMLFMNNGEDLNLYISLDDKENVNSNSKRFKIGNSVVKLSKRFVTILPAILICLNIIGCNHNHEVINKIEYDIPNISVFNPENSTISVEEAKELINSSPIPFGKRKHIGEDLLNDVFAYYKGTNMENIIKSRLENLHIEAYDENMYKDGNISINTFGYYDELTPNVIHIREDYIKEDEDDDVFFHEFVHLLQSNNCEYEFLKETTAEIIAGEYLHSAGIGNYWSNVIDTKILMNIIGPKVVWETVFSGNDNNLVNIIKTNLSEQDANELISYLKQDPEKLNKIENSHLRMSELLDSLYKNINLSDIYDDRNIFDSEGNLIAKIYFNSNYELQKQSQTEFLTIKEMFPDQTIRGNDSNKQYR